MQTTCVETFTKLDARNSVVQSWLFDRDLTDVTSSTSTWRVTSYTRDTLGRLTGVKDPGGNTWSYEYDAFGNRLISDDPDLGFWTMEYDAGNNLTRQTDAKGQIITFAYDIAGRPTEKKVYKADGTLEDTTTSTYDRLESGFYNRGVLTELTNDAHSILYDYGPHGSLRRERHTVDSRTYSLQNTYFSNGQLKDQKLPNTANSTLTAWQGQFAYDNAGRMASFGSHITSVDYDVWDNPIRTNFGNGFTELRTHDDKRGWLDTVRVEDPNAAAKLNNTLTRSASGRITRQWTQKGSGRFDYTYDYAGRLLKSDNFTSSDPASGWQAYDQSFSYNKAGSLMSHSDIGTYVYNAVNANHPHAPRKVCLLYTSPSPRDRG